MHRCRADIGLILARPRYTGLAIYYYRQSAGIRAGSGSYAGGGPVAPANVPVATNDSSLSLSLSLYLACSLSLSHSCVCIYTHGASAGRAGDSRDSPITRPILQIYAGRGFGRVCVSVSVYVCNTAAAGIKYGGG